MKHLTQTNLLNLSLAQLGWTDFFQRQLDPNDKLRPARVYRQDLNRYHLICSTGQLIGILPGKTLREAVSKADLPTVGDWVLVTSSDETESSASEPHQVVIQRTLVRASKFSRKVAGEKFDEQIVAANIDTVFIVTGLDANFNPGRIERYLLLAWSSGAAPVIVLNKTDLCTDLDKKIDRIKKIAMGTPIHAVSALTSEGMASLKSYILEGTTAAVLGSSGVGKSTIINHLLGYDHFEIAEVREGDSRGRHTTTHRELCLVANGGLMIDTPGMREIQFWASEEALATSFEDVERFASGCRFNNCAHQSEPDCAIQAAIDNEELAVERFESYLKFQRELVLFASKLDAGLRTEKKTQRRKFTKMQRRRPTKKD